MPFNEEGKWVTPNPIEAYLSLVKKSQEQPGLGGSFWTSDYRRKLHDEAARYHMELNGIPYSEEAFQEARRIIEEMSEEYHGHDKENNFVSRKHFPKQPSLSPHHKHSGD